MMGLGKNAHLLYIIDFGLSKKFIQDSNSYFIQISISPTRRGRNWLELQDMQASIPTWVLSNHEETIFNRLDMLWSTCWGGFFLGKIWRQKIQRPSIKWLWRKKYQPLLNFYAKAILINLRLLLIMLRRLNFKKNQIISIWKVCLPMQGRTTKLKWTIFMIGL